MNKTKFFFERVELHKNKKVGGGRDPKIVENHCLNRLGNIAF
jgi:hypothetical protein